jgi:carbonic anhydrase/acetyltransferase-like protein (isoleucine patch superfamily)
MKKSITLSARLKRYLGQKPRLGRRVWVAPGAHIVGDVDIGDESSVWFNAVLRADIQAIRIGRCTNIQDNAVLHLADAYPCVLGDYVTVGHSAVVHACRVDSEVLVGMGAVVMDGAVIGPHCIIGAGALVPMGMEVPEGSLVLGRPGRVARALTRSEKAGIKRLARKYVSISKAYLQSPP